MGFLEDWLEACEDSKLEAEKMRKQMQHMKKLKGHGGR